MAVSKRDLGPKSRIRSLQLSQYDHHFLSNSKSRILYIRVHLVLKDVAFKVIIKLPRILQRSNTENRGTCQAPMGLWYEGPFAGRPERKARAPKRPKYPDMRRRASVLGMVRSMV